MKIRGLALLILFASLGLGGCATIEPLKSTDLVVRVVTSKPVHSEIVLAVQEVTAIDTSTYMRPSIDKKVFQRALIGTLQASGMFGHVVAGTSGDYLLGSEIIAQQPLDPYSITIPILVHYRLIDGKTLRPVWKRNIFTQPAVPFERFSLDDPDGQKRHQRMLKEGMRENLSRLVAELRDSLKLPKSQ